MLLSVKVTSLAVVPAPIPIEVPAIVILSPTEYHNPPAPTISGATPPVIVDIPVVAIPPLALVNTENVAPSPPKLEVLGTA